MPTTTAGVAFAFTAVAAVAAATTAALGVGDASPSDVATVVAGDATGGATAFTLGANCTTAVGADTGCSAAVGCELEDAVLAIVADSTSACGDDAIAGAAGTFAEYVA